MSYFGGFPMDYDGGECTCDGWSDYICGWCRYCSHKCISKPTYEEDLYNMFQHYWNQELQSLPSNVCITKKVKRDVARNVAQKHPTWITDYLLMRCEFLRKEGFQPQKAQSYVLPPDLSEYKRLPSKKGKQQSKGKKSKC